MPSENSVRAEWRVVVDAPRVIASGCATVYLARIENPGTEGAWELFDAGSFEDCWDVRRLLYLRLGSPGSGQGNLLLPPWGTMFGQGLTLRSLPLGAHAVFEIR
jgi:hypothetical protein